MRDEIKQIMIEWVKTGELPEGCDFRGFSGGFTVNNVQEHWTSWEVMGSSAPWDKVSYSIYNFYYPDEILEQGVLKIGKYNECYSIIKQRNI